MFKEYSKYGQFIVDLQTTVVYYFNELKQRLRASEVGSATLLL